MIKEFDIYKHPTLYDDQYWWKKDDIEFYKNIISPGSKVLELGAGTGRLALPILRHNVDYYGLELSTEFCSFANEKLSDLYDEDRIIEGDMVNFNLDMKSLLADRFYRIEYKIISGSGTTDETIQYFTDLPSFRVVK